MVKCPNTLNVSVEPYLRSQAAVWWYTVKDEITDLQNYEKKVTNVIIKSTNQATNSQKEFLSTVLQDLLSIMYLFVCCLQRT